MLTSRFSRFFAAVMFFTALTACSEQVPVGPDAEPSALPTSAETPTFNLAAGQASGVVLTRTTPLAEDEVAAACIYPSKNTYQSVKLSRAGLKVSFPPGAVTTRTCVTLRAHAGRYVTYDFQPHGTQFHVPIKVQQELKGTNAYRDEAVMRALAGGYMENGLSDLDPATGEATFSEVFQVYYWDDSEEFSKLTPSVAKFYTSHFSGYALASGCVSKTGLESDQ